MITLWYGVVGDRTIQSFSEMLKKRVLNEIELIGKRGRYDACLVSMMNLILMAYVFISLKNCYMNELK